MEVDYDEIIRICNKQVGEKYDLNLVEGKTLFVEKFDTERHLLTRFVNYIKEVKPVTLTHFRGSAFDLSFVINRCEVEGVNGLKPYKPRDMTQRRREYQFSFTDRVDKGVIKYMKDAAVTNSKRRTNAIKTFINAYT